MNFAGYLKFVLQLDRKQFQLEFFNFFLVKDSVKKFGYTDIFFVDGGGDSLILKTSDSSKFSEDTDPFLGGTSQKSRKIIIGDAELLAAVHKLEDVGANIYQGIIGNVPDFFNFMVTEI